MLAEHFGLARMTVRTEIDRLVTEGLVYRLHGRGTFVAEPRVAQAVLFSSFTEDMRARGMTPGLDRPLARADRGGAVPGAHARGRSRAPRWPSSSASARPTASRWRSSGSTSRPSASRGSQEADLEHGSLFEVLAERYDTSLSGADQRVVAVAIEAEEAPLLGVDEGVPGLRFHTLARDTRGMPAYYATSLFRGDRYEIELHQTRTDGA